jgi:hypothetical protein
LKLIATCFLSTTNNGLLFPIAAAKKVRCPAPILHGDGDQVVPVEEADEPYGCLMDSKRLSILTGADHRLSATMMRRAMAEALDWLTEHVGLSAMIKKKYLPLLFGIVLLSNACGHDLNSAQGVAEEFVDQHYVQIDLAKAKKYAVSVALAKVDEEMRLTSGQQIDSSTQKPRVNYRLLEKHESEKRSTYLYEGKIQSEDGTSFTKKWLITARQEGNQWRVSNFTESD